MLKRGQLRHGFGAVTSKTVSSEVSWRDDGKVGQPSYVLGMRQVRVESPRVKRTRAVREIQAYSYS